MLNIKMSTEGPSFLIYLAREAARPLDPRQLPHCQQCFYGKNGQFTCPVRYLPFRKGSNTADLPFHNIIIGNFIVYQDRIETVLLKLCAHPENSEWFSVIYVIVFEVKIVAEQKQA